MPTPEVISLEPLLAPLPGDDPCGEYLRYDPVYDEIKQARSEQDRDILGQEGQTADWRLIIERTTEILTSRSKDLMVACWQTEALTARHGFAGVRDGLRLLHGLLDQLWDGVHPLPDEGDLEPRVAPLVWLMDADRGARLPNRLRDVPLLPHDTEVLSWTYWKSRYAPPKQESESESDFNQRREEAEERGKVFEDVAASADVSHIVNLCEDVEEAKQALSDLDKLVTERFDDLAPGATAFRKSLEEIEVLLRRIGREKGAFLEAEETTEGEEAEEASQPTNGASTGSRGPISSREDAFKRLAEVAAYLRRTEPQSPVPLLIDRAITWGRLPFDQLLQELVKDTSVRGQVGELLGIRSPDGESES